MTTREAAAHEALVGEQKAWQTGSNAHGDAIEIITAASTVATNARDTALKFATLKQKTALEDAAAQFTAAETAANASNAESVTLCAAAATEAHSLIKADLNNVEQMEGLVKKLNFCKDNTTGTNAPTTAAPETAAVTAVTAVTAAPAVVAPVAVLDAPPAPTSFLEMQGGPCAVHEANVAAFVEIVARSRSMVEDPSPAATTTAAAAAAAAAAAGPMITQWKCDADMKCNGPWDDATVETTTVTPSSADDAWAEASTLEKCKELAHKLRFQTMEFWAGNSCKIWKSKQCAGGEGKAKIAGTIKLCRGTRVPVPTTATPDLADHTGVTGDLADMRRRAGAATKAATDSKDTCLEKANAVLETSVGEHTKTKQWFVNDATGKFTTSENSLKVAYETAMNLAKGQTDNATKVFAGATEKLDAAKLRVRAMMREGVCVCVCKGWGGGGGGYRVRVHA